MIHNYITVICEYNHVSNVVVGTTVLRVMKFVKRIIIILTTD